ncbi:uncharacterized protein LOC120420259 [Culex pipiens pallens]|uniref:uncharacterized protein LOC120420259 n=1 Tax=Culex pipiens pallens TaxID=42434 RepID=UPI0019547B70|nr:uncharacterized protein LOC120420259 [Culex pipiens pallens]
MFATILNVLKNSTGYVNFIDICDTLERTHPQVIPRTNDWQRTVRESLLQAHRQGLIFKSDDRYKFAVDLSKSEDARFATRIEAVKKERLAAKQSTSGAANPAQEIAGPSGYSYRMVPGVASQPVDVRRANGALSIRDEQQSRRRSRGKSSGRGRSRSRSSTRGRTSHKF